MEITERYYAKNRKEWQAWLSKNHKSKKEIWLVYYKKNSSKPRVSYNDAVEEALCYGWIDSTLKPIDEECFAQRYSPRRKNSVLSELNKERIRQLIKAKKMTKFGLESIKHHLEKGEKHLSTSEKLKAFVLPEDILNELKADETVWKNFQKFPETYKRLRVGWINESRHHPEFFRKRLNYFIKMTAKNKRYGMMQ
ncbi:MAG: YdeI/OmpD-associated family protein [Ignavibacteriales bacterium]|nr:YdeI/OmpD-associated family protein [Ignavibacteriales bacterium]